MKSLQRLVMPSMLSTTLFLNGCVEFSQLAGAMPDAARAYKEEITNEQKNIDMPAINSDPMEPFNYLVDRYKVRIVP